MITAEAGTGVAARTAAEAGVAGAAQVGTVVAAGTKPPVGAAGAGTTMVGISVGTSRDGVARGGVEPLLLRNSGMAGVGPGSAVGA